MLYKYINIDLYPIIISWSFYLEFHSYNKRLNQFSQDLLSVTNFIYLTSLIYFIAHPYDNHNNNNVGVHNIIILIILSYLFLYF